LLAVFTLPLLYICFLERCVGRLHRDALMDLEASVGVAYLYNTMTVAELIGGMKHTRVETEAVPRVRVAWLRTQHCVRRLMAIPLS